MRLVRAARRGFVLFPSPAAPAGPSAAGPPATAAAGEARSWLAATLWPCLTTLPPYRLFRYRAALPVPSVQHLVPPLPDPDGYRLRAVRLMTDSPSAKWSLAWLFAFLGGSDLSRSCALWKGWSHGGTDPLRMRTSSSVGGTRASVEEVCRGPYLPGRE